MFLLELQGNLETSEQGAEALDSKALGTIEWPSDKSVGLRSRFIPSIHRSTDPFSTVSVPKEGSNPADRPPQARREARPFAAAICGDPKTGRAPEGRGHGR